MTVLTESSRRNAEFIISEAEHYRSRKVGTVVAGVDTTLEAGAVLGQLTANDNLVAYNKDGADGSQTIAGILYQAVTGTAERTYLGGAAQVKSDKLAWASGYSAGDITTGEAALEALGITVREGV